MQIETCAALLSQSRGDSPADLVIKNAKVVNLFSGRIEQTSVAVSHGLILGLGPEYESDKEIDLKGAYLAPAFIDGHLHVESTLLCPARLAEVMAPHGTGAVIADPHEIANVMGAEGVRAMLNGSEGLPMDFYFMIPSCVPATHLETAGAVLDAQSLEEMAHWPRVLGLAELMNFPGALGGDPGILAKVAAFEGRPIDGHAPLLSGRALNAYVFSGPQSDHECTNQAEALEKLERGLWIMIRQGTTAKDMDALLPLINPVTERRCMLVSDDRHPDDLAGKGHMDHLLRRAVAWGLDPVTALRMVSLNPARRFGLNNLGAIAPGYRANLVELADLAGFEVNRVWHQGRLISRHGQALPFSDPGFSQAARDTMNLPDLSEDSFRIPAQGSQARVIGINEGEILTQHRIWDTPQKDGLVRADPEKDLAILAVVERHHASGNIGLGLIQGLGLRKGALASSVSHDTHNLVVAGMDPASMLCAAREVGDMGGGLAVASGSEVLASLPLPLAGLMSDAPVDEVLNELNGLDEAAAQITRAGEPFMALAFAALAVIPHLRISDLGLVDVDRFELVDLFVE